jgi:hypothetical protein
VRHGPYPASRHVDRRGRQKQPSDDARRDQQVEQQPSDLRRRREGEAADEQQQRARGRMLERLDHAPQRSEPDRRHRASVVIR